MWSYLVNILGKYYNSISSASTVDPDFPEQTLPHNRPILQSELKELVRDLNLWKIQAQLLGSHGWNLLL